MAKPGGSTSESQRLIDLLDEYENLLQDAIGTYVELVSIVPDPEGSFLKTESRAHLQKLAETMEQKANEILMIANQDPGSVTEQERDEANRTVKKVQKTLDMMQV